MFGSEELNQDPDDGYPGQQQQSHVVCRARVSKLENTKIPYYYPTRKKKTLAPTDQRSKPTKTTKHTPSRADAVERALPTRRKGRLVVRVRAELGDARAKRTGSEHLSTRSVSSIQESVHSSPDHALDGGKSTVASPFSRPRWQSQAWQQLHAQRSPARHRQGRPRAHPSRPRLTVLEYWLPVPRWCRSSRVTVQRPPRPHQTCTHDYWTNVVLDSDTMGTKLSGLQKRQTYVLG